MGYLRKETQHLLEKIKTIGSVPENDKDLMKMTEFVLNNTSEFNNKTYQPKSGTAI